MLPPDPESRLPGKAEAADHSSDRNQAEDALHESELRFRNMADHAPVMMWVTAPDGCCTYLNARWYEFTGQTPEEAEGLGWLDATHPEDKARAKRAFLEANSAQQAFRQEYRLRRADGTYRWAIDAASPRFDDKGAYLGYVGSVIDIDERREAEEKLALNEEKLRLALDVAEIGQWDVDQATGAMFWPPRVKAMFGISPDVPVTLDDFYNGVHPDDQGITRKAYEAASDPQQRALYDVEYRTIGKEDGVIRWVAAKGRGLFHPDGVCYRVLGTAIDITARKADELRLRESEARLLALAHASSEVFYRMAPDWGEMRNLDGNGFLADTNDPTRAWLMDYIPEADQSKVLTAIERAIADKAPFELEHRVLRVDQTIGWTLSRAIPVLDDTGEIVEWFGAAADVTARRLAEDRLHDLNETLEAQVAERTAERDRMWHLSTDLMLIANFDGSIISVNPAWTSLLGWNDTELVGCNFLTLVHPEDHQTTTAEMSKLDQGTTVFRFENRYSASDGTYRWISWTAVPEAQMIHAVGRDITAEKVAAADLEAAQEALRQSQKMEAMGQLTGGVAHDFNNLLTPIIGGLDMLQRRGLGDERTQRQIDGALQSADRAKTLVQRLLAFARRQPLQPKAVEVAELVNGLTDLIGSTIGPSIEVVVQTKDGCPPAKADPNQLEMALLNLAVNARDAMPDGGKLTIDVTCETVGADEKPGLSSGDYVVLQVADTGIGMDEETRKRAVEPFFSTKGIGRGTGLGLSMVHGLTAQLGGEVLIQSALGRGTTIELWLPTSKDPISSGKSIGPSPSESKGHGNILVVDDEILVMMGTAGMLEDLGYEVIEANSAEDALRQLAEGLHPDAMLTDHLMPGMTGAELIRAVHAIHPGLPVAIVSGYSEVDGVPAEIPRLSKPFRTSELAETLAVLLSPSRG